VIFNNIKLWESEEDDKFLFEITKRIFIKYSELKVKEKNSIFLYL